MHTNTNPGEFTILLVDDREENLISLEEMLAEDNRRFIKAASGNEALRHVLKNDKIGLIMLDVQMPEMDGFEVARILKANPKTRQISIIFVTAISKEEQYVLRGFDEGAVDYLQKPLDVSVTKAKVRVFEQLYFYQQELKKTAGELESINKQLEKFVYIVAHDLKSPLTGIVALLSLMEMKSDRQTLKNEELREYVDELKQATYHLSDMITAILEYSRKSINEQKVEEVDVRELVQEIAYLLFPPKHIEIRLPESMPVLKTRKLKLQQVFQNLISNAVKFNNKEKGLIEIGSRDNGQYIEFFVKDNGPGVSEDDKEHLFDLFKTGGNRSETESSTGVGLNIMKMLVEEQGGQIRVESEKSKGSTFFFDWKK